MDDLIDRSDQLDERIAGSDAVAALAKASHRNLNLIRLLGAAIILDILLSLAVGYVAYRADQVSRQATSLQQQAHTSCLAGNDARRGQLQLWGYILDLPPSSPPSPEQERQAQQFRQYIQRIFAPRHCP